MGTAQAVIFAIFPGLDRGATRKVLAIVVLALSLAARAGAATPDFQTHILAVHYTERAALGLPPLVWNDTLAAHAAVWARHLAQHGRLEHSANEERLDEGENLWMGTAGAYQVEDMVAGWSAEKRDFRQVVFPDVSASGSWHDVGHYTQMIWRNTTDIGCAVARGSGYDVLVCHYAPPGNFVGESPY